MNTNCLNPISLSGKSCLISLLTLGALASSLSATILLEDSFDYAVGSNLAGNSGGTGFSSSWSLGGGVQATVSNGLAFSGLYTSGGSALITSSSGAATLLNRTSGTNVTTSTVYGSFLFQTEDQPIDSASGQTGSTWTTRFRNGSSSGTLEYAVLPFYGGNSSYYNGLSASGYNDYYYSNTSAAVRPGIYDGSTYLFVTKITGLSTGSGTLEVWILDESGLAAARAAGMTDTALTTNVVSDGYLNVSYTGTISLSSGDVLQLASYTSSNSAYSSSYIMDEIRYGESLTDVTPLPEPAVTGLLLGISVSALLLRRVQRRRR
ncbi:MAG: hypothetical protein Q7Q73_08500 [Verrucomicrobiota bacterium JB024]|nr:hypothetical protein [Verrucomicrobiota bacterium JB024]